MSNVKSCLLVGVGGQGAILISKIMSNGFMNAGYDVKQSEVPVSYTHLYVYKRQGHGCCLQRCHRLLLHGVQPAVCPLSLIHIYYKFAK